MVSQIDTDLKQKSSSYNTTKGNLQAIERKSVYVSICYVMKLVNSIHYVVRPVVNICYVVKSISSIHYVGNPLINIYCHEPPRYTVV